MIERKYIIGIKKLLGNDAEPSGTPLLLNSMNERCSIQLLEYDREGNLRECRYRKIEI